MSAFMQVQFDPVSQVQSLVMLARCLIFSSTCGQ